MRSVNDSGTAPGPIVAAESPASATAAIMPSLVGDVSVAISWVTGTLRGSLRKVSRQGGPLAIMVPGSGAVDRDGNMPGPYGNSMYLKLADALCRQGISTLRFDKRGLFESSVEGFNPDEVVFQDYVDDVIRWAAFAAAEHQSSSVWLIGHSEGGVVALAAARDPTIHGVVLLNTPGRDFGTLLLSQLSSHGGFSTDDVAILPHLIDEIRAGHPVIQGTYPSVFEPLFRESVQPFLQSIFAVDPGRLASNLEKPLLVVSGGKDLQVGKEDTSILQRCQPNAQFVDLPMLNHVMVDVASDLHTDNLNSYLDQSSEVSPSLVKLIVAYISKT